MRRARPQVVNRLPALVVRRARPQVVKRLPALVVRRARPQVVNRLPALLDRHGLTWGDLTRRTLLPARLLARLRSPTANPRLATAERVAAALEVRIEDIWGLARRRRRPGR